MEKEIVSIWMSKRARPVAVIGEINF